MHHYVFYADIEQKAKPYLKNNILSIFAKLSYSCFLLGLKRKFPFPFRGNAKFCENRPNIFEK
jgi:hypothetical protein